MSDFPEFQLDPPELTQGGIAHVLQKISTRKRPLIVGVVVLAVIVGAFWWLSPRAESSSAAGEPATASVDTSKDAWTPTPEPTALSHAAQSEVDADEVVDYLRKAVEQSSGDQQVAVLWSRLGVTKGVPLAIAQTARTGDFALVTVAAVRPTGDVIKVQCEVQRDADGWHIREVQAAG